MTQKFFVDNLGTFIGAFDGAPPPAGAIEVPMAPEDARQVWLGSAWSALPAAPNVDQLAEDVWADTNLTAVRMEIMAFYPLLKQYLAMGAVGQERIEQTWTVNIQPKFDAVNPLISALIIQHALANNIHLVPQEQEQAALAMLAAAQGAQQ